MKHCWRSHQFLSFFLSLPCEHFLRLPLPFPLVSLSPRSIRTAFLSSSTCTESSLNFLKMNIQNEYGFCCLLHQWCMFSSACPHHTTCYSDKIPSCFPHFFMHHCPFILFITSLVSTSPSGIPSRTLTSLIVNTFFLISGTFILRAL